MNYTYDAARAAGDRITSIRVNGALIDPAKSYRIGTFNFLATGGDNFRIFTEGTGTKDSGLVDRDAWIKYLQAHNPVSPDFARRSVAVGEHRPRPRSRAGTPSPWRFRSWTSPRWAAR